MTTLYRPVDVLTPAMARTVGVLHYQDAKQSMWLVPIEAEEQKIESRRFCQAVPDVLHRFTTPWTLYTPQEPR